MQSHLTDLINNSYRIVQGKVFISIYDGSNLAHHSGNTPVYGASVPKIALLLAAYTLKDHLAKLGLKGNPSFNEYKKAFTGNHRKDVKRPRTGYDPVLKSLFKKSTPLEFRSIVPTTLNDLDNLRNVNKLMSYFGNYIYYSLKKANLEKKIRLNRYFTDGGRKPVTAKSGWYLVSGAGNKNITSNGVVALYHYMDSKHELRKGLDHLRPKGCIVNLDPPHTKPNPKQIRYSKCGIYEASLHDTWVSEKRGRRSKYIVCYLTLLGKNTNTYFDLRKDIDNLLDLY